MPLIQPCMPVIEPAAVVLTEMQRVRKLRYERKLSRRGFLFAWGKLRKRLELTLEYQAFRQEVIRRDQGRCRVCGRSTHTVHHRRPVAWAPQLALSVRNGELRCDDCHADEHPHLRLHRS